MTNAELAVLSLVAEKPRHGYEIEQVIEERGMRDWTLADLPGIPAADAIAALRRHCESLAERKTHVQERRESQYPLPDFVDAMFDHSLTMIDAEAGWIEKIIAHLEKPPGSDSMTESGSELGSNPKQE